MMASPEINPDDEVLPKAMDEQLSSEDTKDITTQAWEAREKWYYIGICLEIPVSVLDVIKKNHPNDVDAQFSAMIKSWLERGKNCTWRVMYGALKHDIVGKKAVAEKLKDWLMSKPVVTGRKRKSATDGDGKRKKIKLDKSTTKVEKGRPCPMEIYGSATALNGCAYFQSKDGFIYQYNVSTKMCTDKIECKYTQYGLVGGVIVEKNDGASSEEATLFRIGGVVKDDWFNKPINTISCFSLQSKKWEEEYPPMHTPRVSPQVVVIENQYLIVLGGFDENGKAILSIEVLNLENKVWLENKNLKLPEVFSSMKWFSACLCGNDIFVIAKYDDPHFTETVSSFVDSEFGSSRYEDTHLDYIDPDRRCPCYSLFSCSAYDLKEEAKKPSSKLLWQPMEHPHPSVYYNNRSDAYDEGRLDLRQVDGKLETSYLHYDVCQISLASVNDKLVAIGCNHIKAIDSYEIKESIKEMYHDNRQKCKDCYDEMIMKEEMIQSGAYKDYFDYIEGDDDDDGDVIKLRPVKVSEDSETIVKECYVYSMENNEWNLIAETSRNGKSDSLPSVAVDGNSLVIVRNSTIVHVVTFPQ